MRCCFELYMLESCTVFNPPSPTQHPNSETHHQPPKSCIYIYIFFFIFFDHHGIPCPATIRQEKQNLAGDRNDPPMTERGEHTSPQEGVVSKILAGLGIDTPKKEHCAGRIQSAFVVLCLLSIPSFSHSQPLYLSLSLPLLSVSF